MRILVAALVAWQLMAGSLFAEDDVEEFQLSQRVVVDRDVQVDVDGGPQLTLRRGTVLTIVALDDDRAQVCDLAPVWIDQSDLLSLREAKAKLIRELKENPDDVALLIALGDVYRGSEVHDLAVETYCRALHHEPDDLAAIRGRSESYHYAFLSQTCLDGLERVLEDAPDDAKAHYLRGYVMSCHDHWDDAIRSFDAAVKAAPQFVQAYIERAEAKWRSNDVDGALADYDEAIRLCANATDAYAGRASYYARAGDYTAALADLQKALEINPRAHLAHDKMARLILLANDDEIGDSQQALEHAKTAADLTGGQVARYAITLARAYHAVADRSRAIEWKTHALRLEMAREHYYRTWRFDNAFRHGKPKQRNDAAALDN